MKWSADTLPVVVGVGSRTQHAEDAAATLNPVDLLVEAIRAAADDAGLTSEQLCEIDGIYVTNMAAWDHPGIPGMVAERIGARPSVAQYRAQRRRATDRPSGVRCSCPSLW